MDRDTQIRTISDVGAHIASRLHSYYSISLWQIDGFYIEVFYNQLEQKVDRLRSFEDTEALAPYLSEIDISEVLDG